MCPLPTHLFQEDLTMAKDKIQMPTSTAGITRYFDDYKSLLSFPPHLVIVFSIFVIFVVIFLNVYISGFLGL